MTDTALADFKGLEEQLRVDTSEGPPAYLLIGRNGSHVRLSASAYRLLKIVASGVSFEEAARRISQRQGTVISASELETICRNVVDHLREIDRQADRSAVPPGFWLRVRLLPCVLVTRISSFLSHAFRPAVAWPLAALGAAALVLATALGPPPSFDGAAIWPAYGLFLLSMLAHELGHASACSRFGAPPHDIGFAMYLIYPAFYSDVSAAWRLNRRQRVVVDLGGAFFQSAAAALYLGLFVFLRWEPLRIAVLAIIYSLTFSLNPVFKFDGYWVLADALGVTNLGRQTLRIARWCASRLRGRRSETLPWSGLVTTILFVYTPVSILVWTYFLVRLAPLAWKLALGYPGRLAAVYESLASASFAGLGESLHALIFSSLLLFAVVWMLWRLLGRGSSHWRTYWDHRKMQKSPAAPSGPADREWQPRPPATLGRGKEVSV
jgi:putative peptide zinc metalloprotease protein